MKPLLTIKEVSQLTQLSIGGLYHLISQRRIQIVRISARCIRFRLEDVEKWITDKLVQPRE